MPIVYRDSRVAIDPRCALDELRRRAAAQETFGGPDLAVGFLVDLAEFESAVADALCVERDSTGPLLDALRDASCEAARLWLDARDGRRVDGRPLSAALDGIRDDALPHHARLSVSEGFAYYALFPEMFVVSATRMIAETGCEDLCTIGLRNIGACLAAAVSAALRAGGCRSSSFTMRPRGHPFAREVRMTAALADALRREAEGGACFAVVDEGPGISGSSFAAAVSALRDLGIPPDRIFMFPSWVPSADALSSAPAQAVWSSHRKYVTSAEDAGVTALAAFGIMSEAMDFSAGRWRQSILPGAAVWPDVQPQHERVKWYLPSDRRVLKFAGLGRYGDAALRRAHALADAGLGERPGRLHAGFIDLAFVPGTPLARCADEETAREIGRYIGRIGAAFPAREAADVSSIAEMVDVNTEELFGRQAPPPPDDPLPGVEIDGRMLAHEWIRTPAGGLVKVDALDHHRDHFFPGVQSSAWDLAGAMIELRMIDRYSAALLDEYEAVSGDRAARAQLPYFQLAYAAFRAGYRAMAKLPSDDHYSQCALNAIASFKASSKSPRKQIARSSMNT